jgi:hypothetical protein
MGSDGARVFWTCWIVLAAHFATNVSREDYPAFSLAERGTLAVDPYLGLHSDIFQHTDGHAYIDNNVATSIVAAVPLFLARPLLDALEAHRKEEIARDPAAAEGAFQSEYPSRIRFYSEVRRRGLDLRFGAAAAITAVFVTAPLAALAGVLVLGVLRRRGIPRGRAVALALLSVLGTPLFFRAATLNNNLFLALAVLGAFVLLDEDAEAPEPSSRRLLGAGLLAGLAVAIDYAGFVPAACLLGWVAVRRRSASSCARFALGALPGVLLLLATQWIQFGNPFLPAQAWMPPAHFTDRGWRGFSGPRLDLFIANLVDPDFGLFAYGPVLVFALVPGRSYAMSTSSRRFVVVFAVLFLLFCASNQYARMQWNRGLRHLLPLAPLLFLLACDRLARLPRAAFTVVAVIAVLHEWVLAMVRYHPQPADLGKFGSSAVVESWRRFLTEGVQLPWLSVLRRAAPEASIVHAWYGPYAVLLACALVLALLWRRKEAVPA